MYRRNSSQEELTGHNAALSSGVKHSVVQAISNAAHPMAHVAQFHTRPFGPGDVRSATVGVTE